MARETFTEGEDVEFRADTLPDAPWRRGRYIRLVAGWHEVRTTMDRFSIPPRRIRKVSAVARVDGATSSSVPAPVWSSPRYRAKATQVNTWTVEGPGLEGCAPIWDAPVDAERCALAMNKAYAQGVMDAKAEMPEVLRG